MISKVDLFKLANIAVDTSLMLMKARDKTFFYDTETVTALSNNTQDLSATVVDQRGKVNGKWDACSHDIIMNYAFPNNKSGDGIQDIKITAAALTVRSKRDLNYVAHVFGVVTLIEKMVDDDANLRRKGQSTYDDRLSGMIYDIWCDEVTRVMEARKTSE